MFPYFDSQFIEDCPFHKSALIQVMAGRRTGDNPLTAPMLDHFTDTYMHH